MKDTDFLKLLQSLVDSAFYLFVAAGKGGSVKISAAKKQARRKNWEILQRVEPSLMALHRFTKNHERLMKIAEAKTHVTQ